MYFLLLSKCHARSVSDRVVSGRYDGRHFGLHPAADQPVGDQADRQLRADGVAGRDVEAALFLQKIFRRFGNLWKVFVFYFVSNYLPRIDITFIPTYNLYTYFMKLKKTKAKEVATLYQS